MENSAPIESSKNASNTVLGGHVCLATKHCKECYHIGQINHLWIKMGKPNRNARVIYIYIYDPGSRFATTPPLPPHGMVPKPAFCSILHENVVFAVFLAPWLAGAVCKPANSQEFLQPTFRKRVICNVSASTSWSSAVAPAST